MNGITDFVIEQRDAEDGPAGATARFPFDRSTVERFREAFPKARWRGEVEGWFVPGTTAKRRLETWSGREWQGTLTYADDRGRDAFAFEPFASAYLEVTESFLIRTRYSRTVVEELRQVPWATWDPHLKAWRVPFRSFEDLRKRWPAIESAARRAEPEERRSRKQERAAFADDGKKRALAGELRRRRYPVPEDALPPLDRVLMTHTGCLIFTSVTGELVEPDVATRFYPEVVAGNTNLIWSEWRRPGHAELVQAWPARTSPSLADLARGWWQPTIDELRPERRKAASQERGRATRKARAGSSRDA